ncbi:MAG: dihydrofolate reductase [Silvibacterium sp.]|nr:dihydrofolate reductase [Silvibacterium sp.]MBV8436401.1 dihydrofolate reductase [Silvibacterium sp.]
MRKVVLGLGMSLDGYIARPDGSVDFLFMPKDYSMGPFFKTVDVAVMGRKTLEAGLKMTGGKFDNYGIKCYVMSRSEPPGERDGYEITGKTPEALVSELRKQPGKIIWMMGGGELARDFLKADLIDGMELGIVPVLIGEGIPMFPAGFPQREFKLVENKAYSKGLLVLKYERVRKKAGSKK